MFGLDGSVELVVKATGLLDTELLATDVEPFGYGLKIYPKVNTPLHQHHFVLRLDPMVDGPFNSVSVVDVIPDPAETGLRQNPYGQALRVQRRTLETVAEGCTRIEPFKTRTWEISGYDTSCREQGSWKLVPMNTAPILMRRDSPLFPKTRFSNYDVWVTPYQDEEIYPGGFYLNGRSGLPEIVKRSPHAPIKGKDIVLWHFGLTHVPRAEDFPIMPVEGTGSS